MDDQPMLKQQLPHPFNQDLSGVLTHIDRRYEDTRARLANDPITAAYVAAGMRLIQRHLGPGAERVRPNPDDEDRIERPLLAFLSQRRVAAEVTNNPDPFPKVGTVATLRDRWHSSSDFIADLLNFGLWSANYPQTQKSGARDKTAEQLLTGNDPVQAVHDLAYLESSTVIGLPTFRLRLVADVCADGDKSIAEAMVENLDGRVNSFKPLYAEFLRVRGMQMREGITLDDLANMLQVASTGVAERMLCAPTSEIVDRDRRRSLLGTMALAMIYACVEPTGAATGLTLEQAVAWQLNQPPKAGRVMQSGI
jgi:hypothetical protein